MSSLLLIADDRSQCATIAAAEASVGSSTRRRFSVTGFSLVYQFDRIWCIFGRANIYLKLTYTKLSPYYYAYVLRVTVNAVYLRRRNSKTVGDREKCFAGNMSGLPFGDIATAQWLTTRPVDARICLYQPTDRILALKRVDRFRSFKHLESPWWDALGPCYVKRVR